MKALWLGVLALALPASVSAQVGPFSKPLEVSRLDNGLTVISIPWQSPGIVAYYTLVRVGARDEVEPGHTGFAHLFEHMMFRGTERYSESAYEERIQSFGADNNAYTTQDFTLYTVTAPSTALEAVVDLEADRFQHLQYDERAFRTETGAVLGEYNKSASNPSQKMWEALSELAFKRHTYGHTTIGYLADIQSMPDKYEYSRAFFRRFYTPDNATILCAGEVPHAQLLELVKKHYAGWQGKRDQPAIPAEPDPELGARRHIDWDGMSAPQLLLGYRSGAFAGEGDPAMRKARLLDTAALEVVHGLLFDRSSPLYQALVVEQQRLLDLQSWEENFSRDPGLFVVGAELRESASFEDVEREIQLAIDLLARGEVDPARVDAVRSHLRYDLTMAVATADDAADLMGQFIAVSGSPDGLREYLEALASVTKEDVTRVASLYLSEKRRFTITLKSRKETAQ
ncbi:MAG TPA: pitrilysin family protein [Polyangiales bacterium]|nr:pitrilysin family protein [Polyangiales bacterium]